MKDFLNKLEPDDVAMILMASIFPLGIIGIVIMGIIQIVYNH